MTFKDVAVKNFKFNIKKYFAFFLCSSFAITVLFMYSTLLFNDEIIKEVGKTNIYIVMKFCLVIIGVFCFFFISYAHTSFMKSRNKEFGLFLTLGMTKKDVNRIIKIENGSIALASLGAGLLAGTILSKLFFMIVVKILQFKKIKFILNYKSYALSIGLFLLISIALMLIIKIYTNKLEITELLKSSSKALNNKVNHTVLGVIGAIFIAISFVLMHYTIKGDIFKHEPYMVGVYTCICLLGLYFIISEFGALSIKLSKKNTNSYLKNIISINEINHKFNQYKKILYTVCMLSGAAIFFIGSTFGVYITTKDSVMKEYPYDIMYVETLSENKLEEHKLKEIVDSEENPLSEMYKIDASQRELYRDFDGKYELWSDTCTVFSQSEINKILKKPVNVQKGKVIVSCQEEDTNAQFKDGETIKLKHEKSEKADEFNVQEKIYGYLLNYAANRRYITQHLVILNDEDYKNLINKSNNSDILTFHLFNFKDWKNTKTNFDNLMNSLKESNGISNDKSLWKHINSWKDNKIEGLRPVSKFEVYSVYMNENGFNFFIMSFMGLLFLISSGVVLYFKMYTDIEDGKVRYKKLFRLGITDKEMKKVISKELKPIFFIPVILGSIVGIGYIAVMSENYVMYKELILVSIIVALVYLMLQTIFYFITRNKYFNEILE